MTEKPPPDYITPEPEYLQPFASAGMDVYLDMAARQAGLVFKIYDPRKQRQEDAELWGPLVLNVDGLRMIAARLTQAADELEAGHH